MPFAGRSVVVQPGNPMFGRQRESQRPSSPAYGFGSASRKQSNSLYLGSGMHPTWDPRTPGPGTYAASRQPRPGSAPPGCGFGARTGKRNPPDVFQDRMWTPSPGPATVGSTSTLSRSVSSQLMSAPRYGFGSASREKIAQKARLPRLPHSTPTW